MQKISSIFSFRVFLRILVFGAIILTAIVQLGYFIEKEKAATKRWDAFYTIEDTKIIIFGNSHANKTFDTEYLTMSGIESIILGGNGERFTSTYYNIMEVLDYRAPEAIVIELNSLFGDIEFENEKLNVFNIENIHGMRYSRIRFEEMINVISNKNYINAMFPAVFYHDNWKNILDFRDNYVYNRTVIDEKRGYISLPHVIDDEMWEEASKGDRLEQLAGWSQEKSISDVNLEYLGDIIERCESEGVRVILVKAPVCREEWKYVSKRLEILSNDIDHYIYDYNLLYDELEFGQDDFYDYGHLSDKGAKKVTGHFLHKVLIEELELVDAEDITDSLKTSMNIKSQRHEVNNEVHRFTIETYNNDLLYGFYLYRDGERISRKDYSTENYYEFIENETGIYEVKYFIIRKSDDNSTNSNNNKKVTGYFSHKVEVR